MYKIIRTAKTKYIGVYIDILEDGFCLYNTNGDSKFFTNCPSENEIISFKNENSKYRGV